MNSSIDGIFSTDNDFSTSILSNGTHTVYFRVQDNHGFWSEPDTATFTITGAPFVRIDSPDDNSVHTRDENLVLVGYVSDDDTDGMTYLWQSDIDGILGTSQSINITRLTNGTHIISFSAKDQYDFAASTSITATINGRPIVSITEYPDEVMEGELVALDGSAIDDNDNIVEWLWVVDTGDKIVNVSTSKNAQVILPTGFIDLTLLAKDNYGVWGESTSVSINVVAIFPEVTINNETTSFTRQDIQN